ncbi:hypothetical protein FWH58_01260 [Candidatus Saccharibacteria bacterium]|nr:hypothetical protein [Candidatus Saccharibacteria bacterium]
MSATDTYTQHAYQQAKEKCPSQCPPANEFGSKVCEITGPGDRDYDRFYAEYMGMVEEWRRLDQFRPAGSNPLSEEYIQHEADIFARQRVCEKEPLSWLEGSYDASDAPIRRVTREHIEEYLADPFGRAIEDLREDTIATLYNIWHGALRSARELRSEALAHIEEDLADPFGQAIEDFRKETAAILRRIGQKAYRGYVLTRELRSEASDSKKT